MTDLPILERTSGEIRDRAIADANALRQENQELRYYLNAAVHDMLTPDQRITVLAILKRTAP